MEKKLYGELFYKPDPHSGQTIYYIDKEFRYPFNGIVLDYFKGVLSWEFEVRDGYQTGIERTYYDYTGELESESEMDHNTQYGIAKEFYKSGKIQSIAIMVRNMPTDAVVFDEEGNVTEETTDESILIGAHAERHGFAEFREKCKPRFKALVEAAKKGELNIS